MRMSSLVDSTYLHLVSRLQRAGTSVKAVSRPTSEKYCWRFSVAGTGAELLVSVELMTVNVYKNDKVQIAVTGLLGTALGRTFMPISGNCPPLDAVEAFIRYALAEKGDPNRKSSSTKSEPTGYLVAVEPDIQPQAAQAEQAKKSKKAKRHGPVGTGGYSQEKPAEVPHELAPEDPLDSDLGSAR